MVKQVSRCTFSDLSGGGVTLGNVNDTKETDPSRQMARVHVADNNIINSGREFKGAPGIHRSPGDFLMFFFFFF
jgi:hypothetical protein